MTFYCIDDASPCAKQCEPCKGAKCCEEFNTCTLDCVERLHWHDAKRAPKVYACPKCGTGMEVDAEAKPVIKSEWERMVACLEELYAMVNGECPALLNEDSGGNARLDLAIQEALKTANNR